MSTALKCPNPSCPYLFDPTTVPPGVVLACPRCGMRFTLGTPGAAPPPGEQSSGTFPGSASGAQSSSFPGGTTAPSGFSSGYSPGRGTPASSPRTATSSAFGEMTPEAAKADGQEGPRLPVRANKLQTPLLVGVAAFALAGAAVAIWYKMTHKNEPNTTDNGTLFKDVNLSITEPTSPWVLDTTTKNKLGSPFFRVYKRDNPEAFIAYGAKDFDPQEPRRSELRGVLDQTMSRLLDMETFRPFEADEKEWLGKEAIGFRFRGQLKSGASVEGDAYAVSYKGMGYWFVAWAGENDIYAEQKSEFEEARKRCKLLGEREKWKPGRAATVSFTGDTTRYSVLDGLGMWTEVNDEGRRKGEDPKADKFLIHIENPGKKNPIYNAQALIYVLEGAGDPLTVARGYIEGQENQFADVRGKFIFKPEPELAGGPVEDSVPGNAPYVVLRCTSEKDPTLVWVYVISAIKVGDKIVAVSAKCPWEMRARFDTKLVEFAKSLN